ncbi:branched-chain amino acid transport system II carrier protein [Desulfotomaculum sp. 1211_IL3151]|uniref:branched-chain amino acid transport system II carrier protein n=1 Tax=Desulfotomaculum sp. 1211_IL3151 TaxID=3084055 RepID=UPI002FDB786C
MQLTKKEVFFTGLALLAMFFGAGNLIFPPFLGQQAGAHLWTAMFGFIVTGVGLPLMGVMAVAKAGGDLEYLANRVHPLFSKIITTIVVLSIGPLLAIPRTAATTYEVAVVPFIGKASGLSLAITSLIFFVVVLLFVLRGSKIVDDIGKILTPFLIIFLAIVIIKGIIAPQGTIGVAQFEAPFSKGFLEGYNTMDALASVIFGMVIVNALQAKGIKNKKVIEKATIWAGIIAATGLSTIYLGLAYIGATTGSSFAGDNPGQMLSFLTTTLLGSIGRTVIAIAMTLACLTTAIGLVACCGNFFNRLSNDRISYNRVCIITVLVSLLLANMGLAKILEVSVPLLVTVYPIIIVLVMLALCHNLFNGNRMVYVASIIGTSAVVLTGLVEMIATKIGAEVQGITNLMAMIPWHDQGLGWVMPALLTAALGLFVSPKQQN